MAQKSDETDILGQLYTSFLRDEPIPEWLSAAFIEQYKKGQLGEVRSWDDVFGGPTRYGTGENVRRQIEQGQRVVDEVERLKAEKKSLNEEEFEAIGRRLAVGGKSKVKALLRDTRLWAERVRNLYRGH